MTIIKSIREYMKTCPELSDSEINVNFLNRYSGSVSIEPVFEEPVIRRYSDGGELRAYAFCVAYRAGFSDAPSDNLEIQELFEGICAWVDENNKNRVFPTLDNGTCEKIEVTSNGGIYDTAVTTARYQLLMRLVYYVPA